MDDIYIFSIVFYLILAGIFKLIGEDPVAFISLLGSGGFVLMYIIAKSGDK